MQAPGLMHWPLCYSRYNGAMTHSSLLADLIDLAAALKADSTTGLDEKKRRDRRIGQALQQYRNHAARQIRGWLQQVGIPGLERAGQAGVQRYHVLCLVLAVAGLVTGAGLAQAVLFYTGDAPINTFTALAVLVLPQILLLLVWLITALPWKIPLFSSLRSALGFLHPGRLAQRIAGRFSGQGRHGLGMIWDPDQATVLAPAARWLFSFWSQLFSFGFNVGALLAIFSMIVFSDLAFVWSSTLDLDTATVQRVLSALAWPWHTLYPDAVPGHALIEVSRYYRLEEVPAGNGMATPELAAQLGGWWPFLVAAITCYGLLPRLATLVISWLALRRQLARALSRLPGAPELLARMNSPLITTAASQRRAAAEAGYRPQGALPGRRQPNNRPGRDDHPAGV
jgi:hypothetical protein